MTPAPATSTGGATVASAASTLGLPSLPSERVREPAFADWIHAHDVDLLLNVHSLFVVNSDVIKAPRIGALNLHPGPLPEYAGLNAPSWAIYFGETRHAVTLHWMDVEIDTGAIAYSAEFDVEEEDTGLSLSARCVREGLPLMRRRRGGVADARLTSGPGVLCLAMGIDRSFDRADLLGERVWLEEGPGPVARAAVARGPRVGIDYAGAWAGRPWRFWIRDNPWVSRSRPAGDAVTGARGRDRRAR